MKHQLMITAVLLLCELGPSPAADVPRESPHAFPRMLVGPMRLPDEQFLAFVERVRPEIVVMGAFGAPQWSAQEDVRQWLADWRAVFDRLHRIDVKVVGMIELLNVGNSLKEAEKFHAFYEKRWDERLLGAKPPVTAAKLLEHRSMPADKQTGAHAPRGCAVNPHWRTVEKAFVKALIDAGIDGFITHRNMFGECGCPFCHAETKTAAEPDLRPKESVRKADLGMPPSETVPCAHCNRGFRHWLLDRYDAKSLKSRFGIRTPDGHRFDAVYGHHRDHGKLPTPIQLEGMKYARHAIKECYDDVFLAHGRSLKKDLVVAQWNHMPYFDELHLDGGHIPRHQMTTFAHASADERWSLPIGLWGRGEDFYWYCNWGTCQNTQLDKRFVADVTLYAKLLRSFARGKPYVINKYDFYRPRNMMAEAAALGMIAGAIAVPHRTDEDADTMARYFAFLARNRELYRQHNGESVANVLLIYPRSRTHAGDASGLEMIEVAGRTMIVNHIQFDFVPDDLLDGVDFTKYRAVVASSPDGLSARRLASFFDAGGTVIAVPRTAKQAGDPAWRELRAQVVAGLPPHSGGSDQAAPFLRRLLEAIGPHRLRVDAPYTLEAHLYRQPARSIVHLVNYDHREKAPGRSVVEREAPKPVEPVRITLPLPRKTKVRRIRFLDPDAEKTETLKFERNGEAVTFRTPSFLVYGVCVVEWGD